MRWWALVLLAGALFVAAHQSARAQAAGTASDILVLMAPMGGQSQIALIYPKVVPHTRAQGDLDRLARAAGWAPTAVEVRDLSVRSDPGGKSRSVTRQTDVTAILLNGLPVSDGAFVLQPFVDALGSLNRVEVLFVVPPDPGFRGLRSFDDPSLSVRLLREGGPYRYLIEIKQHGKPLPRLPLLQAPAAASQPGPASASPRAATGSFALVVAIAAGAGFVVLVGLLAWSRRRPRPSARPVKRIPRP